MTPGYTFRVGLLASGRVASRLAEICARNECHVAVVASDGDTAAIERQVMQDLVASLRRDSTEESDIQRILGRITYEPYTSLATCQFIFDASAGGRKALRRLDALVTDPDATLVQIGPGRRLEELARSTTNPGRVVLAQLTGLDSDEVEIAFGTCHLTDSKTTFKVMAFGTVILGLRTVEYRADDLVLMGSAPAAPALVSEG